jgi:hypothetical protein
MGLTFLQHIKTASHALPVPVLGIPQQLVSSLTIWVGPPVRVAHEVRQCIYADNHIEGSSSERYS